MEGALKKVLSVLISIALALSAWPVPALAEMSEEAMGEEPAATTKRVAEPTEGSATTEGSALTEEAPAAKEEPAPREDLAAREDSKNELTEEGLDPQSEVGLALTSEDGTPEQHPAAQDSLAVSSVSEVPEDVLETQANTAILPERTRNAWSNNYTRWARDSYVNCFGYLYTANGRLERVEYLGGYGGKGSGELFVEGIDGSLRYATSHSVVSRSTYVPSDLASQDEFVWGGFYSGASHNYVLTGQTNDSENDGLTVFRLTKYTKAWQYVGNVEIKGANTTVPFDAGTCSMVELNGDLHIRTCHEMYTTPDGFRHQANVQIVVDENSMVVKQQQTEISNSSTGYVSHSFAQFLARSGDAVFGLDHGDAYPRSIFIKNLSASRKSIEILEFGGQTGDNTTGCSVGGMEHSSSASRLLVAGNLANQSTLFDGGHSDYSVARNVFVATTPTPDLSSNTIRVLTSYSPNGALSATTPHLVKINENRFLVLWGEKSTSSYYSGFGDKVYYQFVDGQGNALSATKQAKGVLSNCTPVLQGNRVVWYAAGSTSGIYDDIPGPTFYAIGAYDGKFSSYVPFTDVPANAWFTGVVYRAVGLGLMSGYANGKFGPADSITRGQAAVVLWNMAGSPAAGSGAKSFTDVRSDDYFYNAVRWASSKGVVSGYGNGRFGPNDKITREQFAVMLTNYVRRVRGGNPTGSAADYSSMSDKGKVSSWAVSSVGWCFRNKVLSGSNGKVDPKGETSRAQAAKMVVAVRDLFE